MATGEFKLNRLFGNLIQVSVATSYTDIDTLIDTEIDATGTKSWFFHNRAALTNPSIGANQQFIFSFFNGTKRYGFALIITWSGMWLASRSNASTCSIQKLNMTTL